MSDLTTEDLLSIGFVELGIWVAEGDRLSYQTDAPPDDGRHAMLEVPNALYAFADGETVRYIGKTTRSIRKRFTGYCRPGSSQRTNLHCNAKIKETLREGRSIRILAFTPVSHLRYGEFEINLAAGLEDSLIRLVNPAWNGGERGLAITETAEREALEDGSDPTGELDRFSPDNPAVTSIARFSVNLAPTYYERGIVNPGVTASEFLGSDGSPIIIYFADGTPAVLSSINRRVNKSGGVRLVGNNRQIAEWFQRNFKKGDAVHCEILNAHTLRFCLPTR